MSKAPPSAFTDTLPINNSINNKVVIVVPSVDMWVHAMVKQEEETTFNFLNFLRDYFQLAELLSSPYGGSSSESKGGRI